MYHLNLILLITFTCLFNVIICTLDSSALKPMKSSVTPAPESGFFGFSLPSLPSLNLFSGVPCISESLQSGTCEAAQSCATNSGFDSGKSLCPGDKVCCLQSKKCGETSLLNNTLFSNANYPSPTREDGLCTYTVKVLPLVEAIRIDFVDMILHQPDDYTGECNTDAFWVEGADKKFNLDRLCGHLSGSHIYVPIDQKMLGKPVTLNVALSKDNFDRRWLLRVDQLKDKKAEIPPDYCLQYYTSDSGVISSFNFDQQNETGLGNIDKLKYAICVRQEEGFCKLELESPFFNLASDYKIQVLPNYPSRYPQDASKSHMSQYFYKVGNHQSKSNYRLNMPLQYPNKDSHLNHPGSSSNTLNCFGRDILALPPLDDGSEPVHCTNRFHSTKSVTTSSPFIFWVNNKGSYHGKGFMLKYKQLVC